jgi:hypothetical protein
MPSEAVAIIEDARAPMSERSEALAVVQKSHMPGAGDVVGMDKRMVGSLLGAIEQLQAGWRNPEDEYAKAATQWRTGIAGQPLTRILKKEGPQSLMFADKMGIFGMAPGRWSDKPSPIGFDALRMMVNQTPILNGIVMERIRQSQRFMRRAEQDNQPGFELRHRIKEHAITKDERTEIDALTRFFLNCGWEFHPYNRKKLARDTFAGFVSKIVRDTLTMDAMPIELERTRDKHGIHGFYAIDGATIRLCGEQGYEGDDEIKYVQVVLGIPVTTYTLEEMLYEIRNPRTNVELMGYGYGETEMLVRCVTGFLNAMTLNLRGFDQNYIPKGLLTIFGNYNEEQLTYFKQQWNCCSGDTPIWTPQGAMSLHDLADASLEESADDTFQSGQSAYDVWDGQEFVPALVARVGKKRAIKLIMSDGSMHRLAKDHKLRCVDADGKLQWRGVGDIRPGDSVACGDAVWPADTPYRFAFDIVPDTQVRSWRDDPICKICGAKLESAQHVRKHSLRMRTYMEKHYSVPTCSCGCGEQVKWHNASDNSGWADRVKSHHADYPSRPRHVDMTLGPKEWELLGWLTGDGTIHSYYVELYYHWKKEPWIREKHAALLKRCGIPFRRVDTRCGKKPMLRIYFQPFRNWLVDTLGFPGPGEKVNKRLPATVFSVSPECRRAFLRGLFSADGGMMGTNIGLASSRLGLREDVQLLLRSIGIPSTVHRAKPLIMVRDPQMFEREVGFLQPHKRTVKPRHVGHAGRGQVAPKAVALRIGTELWERALEQWTAPQRNRSNLGLLKSGHGASIPKIRLWAKQLGYWDEVLDWTYTSVRSVEDTGESIPMFDLSMQGQNPQFVGNGLLMHNSMVAGVNNAWTLPVLASPNRQAGATYTPFNVNFNEMHFSKWMTFLVSIICAIYGMGPDEINFESFSARSSSLGSGNDTGEKLAASKEKGLEPVLNFLETLFTEYFLSEFTDKYVFRVTGLHPRDEAQDAEYKKLALTVNEVRAELGYEKMEKVMKVGKNDSKDKDTEPEVVDEIAKALGAVAAGDDPGSPVPAKAAKRMAGGSPDMPGGDAGGPPGAADPGDGQMGGAMGPGAAGAEEDMPSAGELVGNAPINPTLIPLYQQATMPQPQGPMGPEGMDFGQEPEEQDGQAPPEEKRDDFGHEGQAAKAILPVAFR